MAFDWLFEGKNAARLGEGLLLTAQISLISAISSEYSLLLTTFSRKAMIAFSNLSILLNSAILIKYVTALVTNPNIINTNHQVSFPNSIQAFPFPISYINYNKNKQNNPKE